MKITNLSTKFLEEQRFASENLNAIGQGITKKLLDKYKPKDLGNTDIIGERKNQKKVA